MKLTRKCLVCREPIQTGHDFCGSGCWQRYHEEAEPVAGEARRAASGRTKPGPGAR